MSKNVLGKGLGALIPEDIEVTSAEIKESMIEIPVNRVDPNPGQPRKEFDENALKELAVSIKQSGLIQPIIVRKKGDRYELIAGERRLKAAGIAGVESVKAILTENLTPSQRMEIALVENLQRADLNPIEAAMGIRELMTKGGFTQEEVSERIGKERSTVTNLLRLLTLPEEIREDIRGGKISAGHGRALAGLDSHETQKEYWRKTVNNGWSVRRLENALQSKPGRKQKERTKNDSSGQYRDLEDRLKSYFGTKVKIIKSGDTGRIEIEFYNDDQLTGILEKIGHDY
ncbi:MAG: ParB/RepB/Spo0J family partition protein [candidate division Zixibacteria bacterium]|nr:ParB/RepB/Spo0J family partition protein [candidate division Zixibacteria bacterium]